MLRIDPEHTDPEHTLKGRGKLHKNSMFRGPIKSLGFRVFGP